MNVCVVGATKGLGLCLVKKFLSEGGHKVFAMALTASEELSILLERYPNDLTVAYGDVTDEEFALKSSEKCKEALGKIDSLCYVAGVLLQDDRDNHLLTCSMETLRKTFEVNTFGPISIAQKFYPIINDGGKVFNVTSEGITLTSCGSMFPCYGMSKITATTVAGSMNKSVDNVDFYSVHPGRMNTDMGRKSAQIEPEISAEGFYNLMTGITPISREKWFIDYTGKPML